MKARAPLANWFLVVNAEGTILAGFGSGLGSEAIASARSLSAVMTGAVALRLVAARKRPRVGGKIGKRSISISFDGKAWDA